jgi:hypothetical protein
VAARRRVAKTRRQGGKAPRKVGRVSARKVRVSEKDPHVMCGKGTSVDRVFRVEENDGKTKVVHLVFSDRHGWYCEHGRQCPAVADVRTFLRNG